MGWWWGVSGGRRNGLCGVSERHFLWLYFYFYGGVLEWRCGIGLGGACSEGVGDLLWSTRWAVREGTRCIAGYVDNA